MLPVNFSRLMMVYNMSVFHVRIVLKACLSADRVNGSGVFKSIY